MCAPLSLLGGAAPAAWVILARSGAVLAVILAFGWAAALAPRLGRGRRSRPRRAAAGVVAAVGVALCGGFLAYSAAGAEPGWTIAFALLGRRGVARGAAARALACGVGCALLRVEAWPFLLAFGAVLWRRRPQDRPLLAAVALAVPALWFVPELLASGDPLRSGARARIPNPGAPAEAAVPALASLREAAALPLWPLWAGAVAAAVLLPAARLLLAAGLAWIALVAVDGAGRLLGRAALRAPGSRAGGDRGRRRPGRDAMRSRRRARRASRAAVAGGRRLLLVAAWPKLADLDDLRRDRAWAAGLADDLEDGDRRGRRPPGRARLRAAVRRRPARAAAGLPPRRREAARGVRAAAARHRVPLAPARAATRSSRRRRRRSRPAPAPAAGRSAPRVRVP